MIITDDATTTTTPSHTLVVHYSVTGSCRTISVASENPTAAEVVDAFEASVGGAETMWGVYFRMPAPPDRESMRIRPLRVNKSSTQVSSVRNFFRWCTQTDAFQTTLSVFVRGREVPLMPHERIPGVDGLQQQTTVTLLPETTIPELNDAIRTLCLDVLPDVVEHKLAVEDQAQRVRDLKKKEKEGKKEKKKEKEVKEEEEEEENNNNNNNTEGMALRVAEDELLRLKKVAKLHPVPSFVKAIVNSTVIAWSKERGATAVVESLRQFFVLLVREAKHCAEQTREQRMNDLVELKEELEKKYNTPALRSKPEYKRDATIYSRFLFKAYNYTCDEALGMLQEAFDWAKTYDAIGSELFKCRTSCSDGQVKTILKAILYIIEEARKANELERRREYAANVAARNEARQQEQLARKRQAAEAVALKHRRQQPLTIGEMRVLANAQFGGAALAGRKHEIVAQFRKLVEDAAWNGHLSIDHTQL